MNIAQTILQQLGGNKFVSMTGAKNLCSYPNALSFALPSNFARQRINHVKIILQADDLYTIQFKYIRGMDIKFETEYEDIFCDQLQEIFTSTTGLATHL